MAISSTLSRYRLARTTREKHSDRRDLLRPRVAWIPPRYARARLQGLSPKLRAAIEQSDRKTGFVLFGPPGTGKTWALCAWWRYIALRGHEVVRMRWEDCLLSVRASYRANERNELPTEKGLIDRWCKSPVLMLEDLGGSYAVDTRETEFAVRLFLTVIDHRLEQLLPTYITTNRPQAETQTAMGQRIGSRLKYFEWIGIGGRDKRAAK